VTSCMPESFLTWQSLIDTAAPPRDSALHHGSGVEVSALLAQHRIEVGGQHAGRGRYGGVEHHDLGAHARAIVKIDNILVSQADAAGGDVRADGPRLVGAMDAVERVFVGTQRALRSDFPGRPSCQGRFVVVPCAA
jgi:hypothetical protein